jgi:hypothetical protein
MSAAKKIVDVEFITEFLGAKDSRQTRKFLRTAFPKDQQPGKGQRWAFNANNEKAMNGLKARFDEWKARKAHLNGSVLFEEDDDE